MCLFNISHFSSAECSQVMSKRTQKDSGEEKVTAKSKPMKNLVSRCSERTPIVLPSTASESQGKTRHESQTPLSPQTEKYDRTVRPVVYAHSSVVLPSSSSMFQEIGECMTKATALAPSMMYLKVLLCLQCFFFFRDSCGPAVFFSLLLSDCDTLPTFHRAHMSLVFKK